MRDAEFLVRVAAVVAAVALLAGPRLVANSRRITSWLWQAKEPKAVDDSNTILEIAKRLRDSGSKRGVELCQQLIDVMLQPEGKK